jgi:myo-inositol-1(or 4)-monophosphatase
MTDSAVPLGLPGGGVAHRRRFRPAILAFPSAFRVAALHTDDGFVRRFWPRVVSTTLAVAWVAAGRRAAYVTAGHLAESVHFAAGIALCRAAGCVVTALARSRRIPHTPFGWRTTASGRPRPAETSRK